MRQVAAKSLQPGMWLDLEGDAFADPDRDKPELEFEYAEVDSVELETSNTVLVCTDAGNWGFPVDHQISVCTVEKPE